MSDKARGALFAMLGDLEDLIVLDAFAGSGALAFEAISRGAQAATCIEIDPEAQKTIAANIASLNVRGKITLARSSANAWLQTNDQPFDIVLCDPPYDSLQPNLLDRLSKLIKQGGLLVLSWPGKTPLPEFGGLEQIRARAYGDMQLAFYRRIE